MFGLRILFLPFMSLGANQKITLCYLRLRNHLPSHKGMCRGGDIEVSAQTYHLCAELLICLGTNINLFWERRTLLGLGTGCEAGCNPCGSLGLCGDAHGMQRAGESLVCKEFSSPAGSVCFFK